MNQYISINTSEISGDYSQTIQLPSSSKIIDLVRRNVHGYCTYTIVYEYDGLDYPTSDYEIVFNGTGYKYDIDRTYNYLTSIQQGYDEANFSIVHWRRVLSEEEKRELKIDSLLQ